MSRKSKFKFKKNDKIKWTTHGGTSFKNHAGIILGKVPAYTSAKLSKKNEKRLNDNRVNTFSMFDRYIVDCDKEGIYMPLRKRVDG